MAILTPGTSAAPPKPLPELQNPLTVAIVDDHALFRAGLRRLLGDLGPSTVVVEFAAIDHASAALARDQEIALILVNEMRASENAYAGLATLIAAACDRPIVIMERGDRRSDIREAIRRGAKGFVAGSSSDAVMVQALRLVLAGGTYVPPAVLDMTDATGHEYGLPTSLPSDRPTVLQTLTPRQLEVLELIAQGYTNKDIAERLGLTIGTVKVHVFKIFKALNVRNRTQAVIVAAQLTDLQETKLPSS